MFMIKTNNPEHVQLLQSWTEKNDVSILDKDNFAIKNIKTIDDIFFVEIDTNSYIYVLEFISECYENHFEYDKGLNKYIMDLT